MTRAIATLSHLGMILIIAAAPVLAQSDEATSARLDALFGAHEPYETFLARLKHAVAAGERRSVAAMIAYPLEASVAGEPITLASPQDVRRRYDQLVTPAVAAALERQTFATLFASAEGAMVGDGEIWFSGICADATCAEVTVKIIALNPPGAPGGPDGTDSGTER